jgi:CheY-like chemotaxis protein
VASREGASVHQHAVLVVDESEETREMLATVLELEGYRAIAAGGGHEALYLTVTLRLRPCLILVDLMPKTDGLTLMVAMLAHPDLARIPAVALSSHGYDVRRWTWGSLPRC